MLESSLFHLHKPLNSHLPEGSAIKGISFYEIDTDTGLITYVRDVPESGIKPPPLGKIARQFRPALGVFQPVAFGSRKGGL